MQFHSHEVKTCKSEQFVCLRECPSAVGREGTAGSQTQEMQVEVGPWVGPRQGAGPGEWAGPWQGAGPGVGGARGGAGPGEWAGPGEHPEALVLPLLRLSQGLKLFILWPFLHGYIIV